MKTLTADLVTKEKSTILAHDGPGRAPRRAKGCLGRNLGHFGGPMAMTGKKGQIARLHGSYSESDDFDVFMMFSGFVHDLNVGTRSQPTPNLLCFVLIYLRFFVDFLLIF